MVHIGKDDTVSPTQTSPSCVITPAAYRAMVTGGDVQ